MINLKAIKAGIRMAGITQKELAEKIGIDPATLSKKLNNEDGDTLTVKQANDIADALGIPQTSRGDIFFAPSIA